MPTRFNDITVSRRDPDGMLVTTHMVASVDVAGERYTASASASVGLKLPPSATASYAEMLGKLGEVRHKRGATLNGADATELEIRKEKMVARYRVTQHADVIYLLTVEINGQEFPQAADEAAAKFFDSFRFPTPEANNAPGGTASAGAP